MKPCRLIFDSIVIVACSIFVFAHSCVAQTSLSSAVDVRLVTDEAEAVLNVLAKKKLTNRSPMRIGNEFFKAKATFASNSERRR